MITYKKALLFSISFQVKLSVLYLLWYMTLSLASSRGGWMQVPIKDNVKS